MDNYPDTYDIFHDCRGRPRILGCNVIVNQIVDPISHVGDVRTCEIGIEVLRKLYCGVHDKESTVYKVNLNWLIGDYPMGKLNFVH